MVGRKQFAEGDGRLEISELVSVRTDDWAVIRAFLVQHTPSGGGGLM
jgi:hypothetical protein